MLRSAWLVIVRRTLGAVWRSSILRTLDSWLAVAMCSMPTFEDFLVTLKKIFARQPASSQLSTVRSVLSCSWPLLRWRRGGAVEVGTWLQDTSRSLGETVHGASIVRMSLRVGQYMSLLRKASGALHLLRSLWRFHGLRC